MSLKCHNLEIGGKVTIIQDVREGGDANGQIATYDGDFPLTVALKDGDRWVKEIDYKYYQSSLEIRVAYPLWNGGEDMPQPRMAMQMDNPRFTLPDGSKIWGVECWWEVYRDDRTLEEMESDLENHKEFLRSLFTEP